MIEATTLLELFSKKERWGKLIAARDENGNICHPKNDKAACWCLAGGCEKISTNLTHHDRLERKLIGAAVRKGYLPSDAGSICPFNDSPRTTYEMVLEVIKEAGV